MPRKTDSIPIKNETLDKRVKLTQVDKQIIKFKYETGGFSLMDLAIEYKVSKRTIQFVIDPAKLEQNKQRRAERGGSKQYYDKEKHAGYVREHRNYKKELNKQGKL